MEFYSEKNVYEAAKDRIREIFKRFPDKSISVSFSGGKDSTTILFLTKEVMDEIGIKKIPVFFLDQEIEAPMVIEHMREIMSLPWVEPYWVQSEFPKFNAHSGKMEMAWDKSKENLWVREKEPNNKYIDFGLENYDSYRNEYDYFQHHLFGDCHITLAGLHMDESPSRRMSLGRDVSFCPKATQKSGEVYYPLFDWHVYDIWYYIFSNRVPYCKLYNYLFSKENLARCRVGSMWHEHSHQSIKLIKEISPDFYNKVQRRLQGVSTTVNAYSDLMQYVKKLPPYFRDWDEYVEYLTEHLVKDVKMGERMVKRYYSIIKSKTKGVENDKVIIDKVREVCGKTYAKCIIKDDYSLKGLGNISLTLTKMVYEHKRQLAKSNQGGIQQ